MGLQENERVENEGGAVRRTREMGKKEELKKNERVEK